MDMFDALMSLSNVNPTRIARYESPEKQLIVSTIKCGDGLYNFETAISHKDYNEGEWMIVAAYNESDSAVSGHNEWVVLMTSEELPESILEVENSVASQVAEMGGTVHQRKR